LGGQGSEKFLIGVGLAAGKCSRNLRGFGEIRTKSRLFKENLENSSAGDSVKDPAEDPAEKTTL
jgi:hypothetical protein